MIINSYNNQYLLYIVILITLFIPLNNLQAQTCNALVPPTTVSGVSVTSSSTGSITSYPTAHTSCGLYTTPANSIHIGMTGPFTYTLNFSAPVNCLDFVLTGTGQGGNEDFTLTTNTGVPSITDNGSCFTTITGNLILSGAGASGINGGGGGNFTVVNPTPFTTLTISGGGGLAGSLFAICEASLVSNTVFDDVVTICVGDSVYLEGAYQTTAGTYSDTVVGGSICGGDSITNTTLTVAPLPTPTINPITDQCESNDSTNLVGNPTGGIFSGNGVTGTNFNPSIAGSGTHTITYHYTDNNGCSDSTNIDIVVLPAPPISIDPLNSLCANETPIPLTGTPNGGTFTGTGVIGNVFDPVVAGVGNHTVTYNYTYTNGCIRTEQTVVEVNEVPVPFFSGDELAGCKEHTLTFIDSTAISPFNCSWDFGDGQLSTQCDSVTHTYLNSGLYDVSLTLEDSNGCIGSTTLIDYIEVYEGPTANFSANPMITDFNNTEVNFTNESQNANDYIWDFGDFSNQITDINPNHSFPTGEVNDYFVTLYASDTSGCIDSTVLKIKIIHPELSVDIPNVFTPNGDSENDFFKLINAENLNHLEVIILNRWGNVVFESSDVDFKWNGTIHNSGENCTEGTYFYKINLTDLNGKEVEQHGFVQLLRGK